MRRRLCVVFGFVMFLACRPLAAQDGIPPEIPLWPDGAPGAQGSQSIDVPTLRVYLPEPDKATGAAVVVCPGGGYHVVAIDHEGAQAARELNRAGVAAFVLKYRRKPKYTPDDALADAQRALRWVRHHADQYQVDPARLGIMGFSAGGHLASNAGTHFDSGNPDAADPIDRHSSRPSFLVLCYPVIVKELYAGGFVSTNEAVTPQTPPTFLFHTTEDTAVPPENSLRFYQALVKANVPAELHLFAAGPHGVGLAPGAPGGSGQWPALMAQWMRAGKWLTPEPRVPVSGTIRVDGKPMAWGWVTFVPEGPGAERRPIASAFLPGKADGSFSLDASHGPVTGAYRIEVRRVGTVLGDSPTLADFEILPPPGTTPPTTLDIQANAQIRLDLDVSSGGRRE